MDYDSLDDDDLLDERADLKRQLRSALKTRELIYNAQNGVLETQFRNVSASEEFNQVSAIMHDPIKLKNLLRDTNAEIARLRNDLKGTQIVSIRSIY